MAPCALGRARGGIAHPALLLPGLEEQERGGGRGSGHQHLHWSGVSSPAQTAAAATGGWERAPPPLSAQLEPPQDSAAVGGIWTAHRAPSTSLGHAKHKAGPSREPQAVAPTPGLQWGCPMASGCTRAELRCPCSAAVTPRVHTWVCSAVSLTWGGVSAVHMQGALACVQEECL